MFRIALWIELSSQEFAGDAKDIMHIYPWDPGGSLCFFDSYDCLRTSNLRKGGL